MLILYCQRDAIAYLVVVPRVPVRGVVSVAHAKKGDAWPSKRTYAGAFLGEIAISLKESFCP